MAGNPEYQNVHQAAGPPPVTPADTPSSPSNYAAVTPHGRGPAPYDIQAPLMDGEITSAFNSANADAGAGVLYPQSARQREAAAILDSPQGAGLDGLDVMSGTTAGWPADIEPGG